MSIPVQIQEIIDGIEMQSDERTSYLHRSSGEVFTVADDEFTTNETDLDGNGPEAIARAIDDNPDAYIALPDRFEIDEYRMMQRFAYTVSDEPVQEQLLRSLRGAGAFRRFKDAAHRIGVASAWYRYRDNAFAKVARDWCAAHGIEFEDLPADSSSQPSALDAEGAKPHIAGIAPFFIVRNVPAALAFYRDGLGFDITFQGPDADDIFFGIVQRGGARIILKDVGVDPLPNSLRDVQKGWARWDAYLDVPDPDALAAEFLSRNVKFSQPLKNDDDGLRGFEVNDADGYVLFFGRPRA